MTTRGETHDTQVDFRCCHRRRHRRRRAYLDRSFRRRRGKRWWWNGWRLSRRLSRPLGPWLRPRLWRNCGDRTQLLAEGFPVWARCTSATIDVDFSLGPGLDSRNRGPVHSMTGEWEMEKIILEH